MMVWLVLLWLLTSALADDIDPIEQRRLIENEHSQMVALSKGAPPGTSSAAPLPLDTIDPSDFDVPVAVTPAVERWLRYFLGSGRPTMKTWLERAPTYEPMIREALAAGGLPEDLRHVAMIESGYNPVARSRFEAYGLWQFMVPTAEAFGLRIDPGLDERADPVASTKAAVAYLSLLYARFDDWHLALAAYNGGPGRVDLAIRASGSRDFEVLAEQHLPSDTVHFVPKFIAATILSHDPEGFGLSDGDDP